ncbi:MAG: LysM peptidoglycan-binding domain-containing protein [Deltaproteobacteria bacterium]|nr:LysM peptidoglycan-binding domain-containing protein [Deltaproteobacteria bacterium]
MMKRPIFLWMGLIVLFLLFTISHESLASTSHEVIKGDTLGKISKKYGVGIQALKEANGLSTSAIKIKQVLVIPQNNKISRTSARKDVPVKSQSYIVKKGDNLYAIAKKTGHSVDKIKKMNHLRSNALKIGQKLVLVMPVAENNTLNEVQVAIVSKTSQGEAEDDLDDELEEGDSGLSAEKAEEIKNASSKPLGTWSRDEQKLFVRVAVGFMGTPYKFGGQSVRGLDCSAFVKKIYEFFEVQLPRTAREQAHVGMSVPRDELQEGDLVFFNTKRAFGHVGIYIGGNKFVHASFKQKQVRVDQLMGYYDRRFAKAVRLKKFDEGA